MVCGLPGSVTAMSKPEERSLLSSESMLLVGVASRVRSAVEDAIADLGLTIRHLGALGHLAHQPELSYSDLARRASVTSQSMRATIDQLAALDAVSIDTEGQGKAARLAVTQAGHDLLDTCRQRISNLDDQLTATLGANDRQALSRSLTAIVTATITRQATFGLPDDPDR